MAQAEGWAERVQVALKGLQFRRGMRIWMRRVSRVRAKVVRMTRRERGEVRAKSVWKRHRMESLEREVVSGQMSWRAVLSCRAVVIVG